MPGPVTSTVRGMKIEIKGQYYEEETKGWLPVGLFELNPKSCNLNLTASNADIDRIGPGVRRTRGVITVDGTKLQ